MFLFYYTAKYLSGFGLTSLTASHPNQENTLVSAAPIIHTDTDYNRL